MAGDEIDEHTVIDWMCLSAFALKHKGYSFWLGDDCLMINQKSKKEMDNQLFHKVYELKRQLGCYMGPFNCKEREQTMKKINTILTSGGFVLTTTETHFTFKDTLYFWLSWIKSLSCF